MRYSLRIFIVCMFLFSASAFAQFGPPSKEAQKAGWWIKVKTQNPASQGIAFYLGASRGSYGFWSSWAPGTPAEFDVSQEFLNSPTLFVLAQTTSGQKCGFCLMYKSKGIRYFEFDLEDGQLSKQSDVDKKCD
jgi:hypothetical protein